MLDILNRLLLVLRPIDYKDTDLKLQQVCQKTSGLFQKCYICHRIALLPF